MPTTEYPTDSSSSVMRITTNAHHVRLLSGYELTPKERAEVDYIDDAELAETSDRFFRYQGALYDTHEFSRVTTGKAVGGWDAPLPADHPFVKEGWSAMQSDSYFSGVLFRYVPDTDWEEVVVGRYSC